MAPTSETISCVAHFSEKGLEGKLSPGRFHGLADVVIQAPSRRAFSLRLSTDGSFSIGQNDLLAPDQFVAGTVLTDAERHFEVTTDGTTRYYLFAAGQEVSPSTTLRDLLHAGGQDSHEHKLTLKLRTETISG